MLDAYVAAGGNFVDTANVYNSSEECVGRWLAKREKAQPEFRQSIVLATKVHHRCTTQHNTTQHRPTRLTVLSPLVPRSVLLISLATLWVRAPTSAVVVGSTSRTAWLPHCVGYRPATSTCTRSTPGSLIARSLSRCSLWTVWCGVVGCATWAAATSPPGS